MREEEPGEREAPERKGGRGHWKTTYSRAVYCNGGSAKGCLRTVWFMTEWFITACEMGRKEGRRIRQERDRGVDGCGTETRPDEGRRRGQ